MRGVRCREQRAAATRCGLPGEACRARCGSLSFLQSLIRSYMLVLDHSRCDQLAWYSWPRRRQRHALPCKACRRHPARRAGQGVASPQVRHGAAAAVRSVPLPPGGNACHQCTREPTTPGDSRRGCQRCCGVPPQVTVCPLVVMQLVGRQAPVSRLP